MKRYAPSIIFGVVLAVTLPTYAVATPAESLPLANAMPDTTSVAGFKLQIKVDQDTCILQYQGQGLERSHRLAPKPPCFFLRNKDGTIQHVAYPDVSVKATLIVAGTAVSPTRRKTFNLAPELNCGDEAQGILINDKAVMVSKAVTRGGVICQQGGTDEKDFWFFAHPKFYEKRNKAK